MKKIFIILMLVPIMCWANLELAESQIIVEHPGISLVKDESGDLFLVKCPDPPVLNYPCSLHPDVLEETTPPWTDIQMAKVHQVGKKWVDFMITTYGDIPEVPPFGFFSFSFAINFFCLDDNSPHPPYPGIAVTWNGDTSTWSAIWFNITDCHSRFVEVLDDNLKFNIEGDTVKVRVPREDLATMVEGFDFNRFFFWTAYSRRCAYTYDN